MQKGKRKSLDLYIVFFFIWCKLSNAKTDDEVQEILKEDDTLDVLEGIGYWGVPQRETLSPVANIIRFVIKQVALVNLIF